MAEGEVKLWRPLLGAATHPSIYGVVGFCWCLPLAHIVQKQGIHLEQVTSQGHTPFIHKLHKLMHVFGLLQEIMQTQENIQSPSRKAFSLTGIWTSDSAFHQ